MRCERCHSKMFEVPADLGITHHRCPKCFGNPNPPDLLVGYRLHSPNAKVPTYAHEGDAGADLYAVSFENVAWKEPFNEQKPPVCFVAGGCRTCGREHNEVDTVACAVRLAPGRSVLIHTELSLYPPMGWEVSIRGRSGLAFKHGIVILHVGTGDAGFAGHYDVMLKNVSGAPYELKPGDRIAQAVFSPVGRAAFEEREAPQTQRGEKGYGSSGS